MTWSRAISIGMMIVGAIAFVFVLYALDWDTAGATLRSIGFGFAVIAAIDLASVMCDASVIHAYLRTLGPASYPRVFAAQASGLAINRLTPTNSLGEPTKLAMLFQHFPKQDALSALARFHLVNYFCGLTFILLGVPITLLLVDLPDNLQLAVWIGSAVLLCVGASVFFLVRRGAAGTVVNALARIRLISDARRTRWRDRVATLDADVKNITNRRAIASTIGSRLLNATGTVVLLYTAGFPMSAPLIAASLSVGQLITWISNVIPLGLGLADGGNVALYRILGLDPQLGLVFALVNRLRTIILSAMGLAIMVIANATTRSGAPSRAPSETR